MSFGKNLRKFIKSVEEDTIKLHKRVSFDLLRFTVKKNPVDTGLLRANWNLGLNAPVKEVRGKVNKKGKVSSAGNRKIANSNISGLKLGDTVFMNNPVKYAVFVEFGSATNAPRAMLSRSLEEVRVKYS